MNVFCRKCKIARCNNNNNSLRLLPPPQQSRFFADIRLIDNGIRLARHTPAAIFIRFRFQSLTVGAFVLTPYAATRC